MSAGNTLPVASLPSGIDPYARTWEGGRVVEVIRPLNEATLEECKAEIGRRIAALEVADIGGLPEALSEATLRSVINSLIFG